MIPSCGSIAGALPACLMVANNSTYEFAPVADHIQSIMTNHDVATSTNPKYIAYGYAVLTNLTLNNEDTRLILK